MKTSQRKQPARPDQVAALFTAAEYFEERGEFRAAFTCLSAAADAGDAGAQQNLGNFYAHGTGTRKNSVQAAYWYKQAFRQGNSSGAFNYAVDLRNAGHIRAAITWFRKARAVKDGSACLQLAKIYAARKSGRIEAVMLAREALDRRFNTSEQDREDAEALLRKLGV